MDLNIFKKIGDSLKKENTTEFLNQLKNSLEESKERECDIFILDKIQDKNKLSIGTKNKMENEFDRILLDYSKETEEQGELYYIVEKRDNEYITYKYENGEDSVIKFTSSELPGDSGVNSILRFEGDKYIIDEKASTEIENRINEMADRLIEEQGKILEEYRKEGHLYRVSENINGSVFLRDMTEESDFEIEEVDFPEELLDKATEGAIFEYIEEEYRIKE